jgi:O-antigen ligase
MSGREYLWEKIKENCYYGNELVGKGLGEAEFFSKNKMYDDGQISKVHNDYLILLCDTGQIGIMLIILFYFSVILKVTSNVTLRRSSSLVKLTGIMALPSMAGIAFCMYFDNVVSTSMQSMVMPYIYIGFFLKALEIEKRKSSTLSQSIN